MRWLWCLRWFAAASVLRCSHLNRALCVNLNNNLQQTLIIAKRYNMKIPKGLHTITPYFTVSDADQLIEFVVQVFDGSILVIDRYPNGRIQHARIGVGSSVIMLNECNEHYPANVSQMYLYVEDVESKYSKALDAGAASIMEPNDRPYGDRIAGIKDPCGNIWWIAKHAGQQQ